MKVWLWRLLTVALFLVLATKPFPVLAADPVVIYTQTDTPTGPVVTPVNTGNPLVVSGPIASGGATSGNPVLVAGSNGVNTYTLSTDTSGRLAVVAIPPSTVTNVAAVTVDTSGEVVGTKSSTRKSIMVQNTGTVTMECGTTGITSTAGLQIGAGATLQLYVGNADVKCITASSTTTAQGIELS